MLIIRPRQWNIPEHQATPPSLTLNRRGLLAGAAAMAVTVPLAGKAAAAGQDFDPDRPLTPEPAATTYNNFYEFGTSKDIWEQAQRMALRPWQVTLDGLVARKQVIDADQLIRMMPSEQRVYRHRCVEAWAMTVPWTGFPLAALVQRAAPLSAAKWVRFETAQQPAVMPGLASPLYSWPYVEGLSMAEAMNELAFIATGLYGKPLPPQNGAPLRVVLPWKYGFKSIKSIVRITFTDQQPETFWASMAPDEYGFWANVNPAVPHPRWSQATERLLGSDERVPTRLFNGYGKWVAGLYTNSSDRKLFM